MQTQYTATGTPPPHTHTYTCLSTRIHGWPSQSCRQTSIQLRCDRCISLNSGPARITTYIFLQYPHLTPRLLQSSQSGSALRGTQIRLLDPARLRQRLRIVHEHTCTSWLQIACACLLAGAGFFSNTPQDAARSSSAETSILTVHGQDWRPQHGANVLIPHYFASSHLRLNFCLCAVWRARGQTSQTVAMTTVIRLPHPGPPHKEVLLAIPNLKAHHTKLSDKALLQYILQSPGAT
jgi:hypothetical protein